jgi:hypothetical protein
VGKKTEKTLESLLGNMYLLELLKSRRRKETEKKTGKASESLGAICIYKKYVKGQKEAEKKTGKRDGKF